jgi:hypothetical protein
LPQGARFVVEPVLDGWAYGNNRGPAISTLATLRDESAPMVRANKSVE